MWINSFFPFYIPVNSKKLNRYENDIEFQNTFFKLFNLTVSAFKWDNLPPTCNSRYLETSLILDGIACIVNDSEYGLLSLKASRIAEKYNMYGETDKIQGIGWNGFNKQYTCYMEGSDNISANAVICRDNPVTYPYINILLAQANRLTNTMRSIDVAVKKLKVPYFITCEESQKASVEKILNDVDENKERIITSKATNENMFNVFPTRTDPNILAQLWNHYNNIDSQTKTILGIDNAVNQDKKERLITDEVNANNVSTELNIAFRLREREKFCEIVNKMFGTNISVSINPAYGEIELDIEREENEDVD